jgi:molecular chaperone DnaK
LIQARNTADQLIYQMEKMLRDLGDKVQASDRGRIEGIVEELKRAKEGDDAEQIKQLIEQLQQASYAIGQQMYAQQAGAQQEAAAGGPQAGGYGGNGGNGGSPGYDAGAPSGEDEVVEGEFSEV